MDDQNFGLTMIGNWLSKNPLQINVSYGLALNAAVEPSNDGGVLHWLNPDSASFKEPVVWKTLINTNSSLVQFDSFVMMDSYDFDSGGDTVAGPSNLLAVLDPVTSSIIFPQSEARRIYDTIPGSSPHLTLPTSTIYNIPCDAEMKLTLTFGELSFTLDQDRLIRRVNETCYGVIEEWTSSTADEYLLGSTFVNNIYLIYRGSNSSSSYGLAQRKEPKAELSLLATIGIGIGVIGFVLASIIATYLITRCCMKRKHRRSNPPVLFEPLNLYRNLPDPDSDPLIPRPFMVPPSPDWRSASQVSIPATPSPDSNPAPNRKSSAQYTTSQRRPSDTATSQPPATLAGPSSPPATQDTRPQNEPRSSTVFIQLQSYSPNNPGSTFYTLTLPTLPVSGPGSHSNFEEVTTPPPYTEHESLRH
ncbi:hypothetical protein VNI00_006508 [Paramarasmius palmivorus]|uniref:Peptidase A1 domain-containing protein n=1 Tax=Paramarasmius palmivorus TaxID=297713 RepID=A0AAW0D7T4_9AGAR